MTLFTLIKKQWALKLQHFCTIYSNQLKKINIAKYLKILIAPNISPHPVANTHSKQILEASFESEQEFFLSREQPSR